MGERDKELIEQARRVPYMDWFRINDLIVQADSDEAKAELEHIKGRKYHDDEYYAGIL